LIGLYRFGLLRTHPALLGKPPFPDLAWFDGYVRAIACHRTFEAAVQIESVRRHVLSTPAVQLSVPNQDPRNDAITDWATARASIDIAKKVL
jgi:hypothetical protein